MHQQHRETRSRMPSELRRNESLKAFGVPDLVFLSIANVQASGCQSLKGLGRLVACQFGKPAMFLAIDPFLT